MVSWHDKQVVRLTWFAGCGLAPTVRKSLGSGIWHSAIQSSSSAFGAGVSVDTTGDVGVAEVGDTDALGIAMIGVSVIFGRGVGSG